MTSKTKSTKSTIHFIVHEPKDTVGVVVVEGIRAGQTLRGWVMASDKTLSVKVGADIPIGHKLAVVPMSKGATAVKYGEDIGKMVGAAGRGDHVHTHNLKTKRW